MVTFQMLRLYTLILAITIKDTLLWENKMILNIKIEGKALRGQGQNNLNCPSKNACFWETWTP